MQKQKNISQGYKLTEVGVIPEDWMIVQLADISKIFRGASPRPIDDPKWFDNKSNVGWLRISDVSNTYKYLYKTVQNLSEKGISKSRFIRQNKLVMSICATIGKPVILKKDVCIHDGFVAFEQLEQDVEYIYYVLKNIEQDWTKNGQTGSQTNLNTELIKTTSVALPVKREEQITIANALSGIDALIQSIKKLINKKQAIKTATMQQLLTGKKRLPEFAYRADGTPKGTKQSELGEIPEDWVVKNIGSFTNCTAGGTPNTKVSSYWGGTHPWMSSGELHLKQVFDVAERITDEGLENSSTKYVPQGSVLIGLAGQGKTRGTVAISRIGLCTNQSIAAIYPSKNHISEYLYYNLDIRYEELRSLSTGDGGRGGLNLKIIKNIILPMPSVNEQTAIVTILSDMDKEIETLQTRLHKTEHIKQGMMQELLTGKTRLVTLA